MPFTPFHVGPSALVALPLKRFLDVPVFILASFAVDLEPLAVLLFGLKYPLHGHFHTFLIGSFVGLVWGGVAFVLAPLITRSMAGLGLAHRISLPKMLVSGVLGVWFHVLLDAPLYDDIRPFFPMEANPLHGLVSASTMYIACLISFGPALVLYLWAVRRDASR